MSTLTLDPGGAWPDPPEPAVPARPGGRASQPAWLGTPSLRQCVTLALLIHVLVVLVFGNAPGGSAPRGEGVWGALNIRLAGGDASGRREATVAADTYNGPAGSAKQQRWGGAVRAPELTESQPPEPGAAKPGLWQARPAEGGAEPAEAAAPAPPNPAPRPTTPAPTEAVPTPRLLAPAATAAPTVAPVPAAVMATKMPFVGRG